MKNTDSLKIKSTKKITLKSFCALMVIALLYLPLINVARIGTYVYDTAIQIKIGLDSIAQHRLILDDIYSWHTGLNWIPHESGWYLLIGAAYKILGLFGVILLTMLLLYPMVYMIYRDLSKKSDLLTIVIMMAISSYLAFPDINARPHLVSQLLMVAFSYTMLSENMSDRKKIGLFCLYTFIMTWFHGGMIPIFFFMYVVYIVVELIYRNFKTVKVYLVGLVLGFLVSLINPTGINVWTYGLIQTQATDLWVEIAGWQPTTFTIPAITLILLVLIGFGVDKRLQEFDKNTIIRLCFICMFLIGTCKYVRFMTYFGLFFLMFGTEEFGILLEWINKNVIRSSKISFKLSEASYGIIGVCALAAIIYSSISSFAYFKTNSLDDCGEIMAYDNKAIALVKEKGYKDIFNSFNVGSYVAFYDIPVHIDNRSDLYMREYSGEDHTRGEMYMNNIESMNKFVDRYGTVEAFLIEYNAYDPENVSFVEDVKCCERYTIVYDNTVVSPLDSSKAYRWLVVEVNQ